MGLAGNKPLPVDQFAGLRLDLDASEAGWSVALDALNVDFGRHGRIATRRGTEKFTPSAGAAAWTSLFSFRGTLDRLLVTGTNRTDAYDSTGASLAAIAVGPFVSAATIGTTSETQCYLAYSTAAAMRLYDGTSFSTPTATVDTGGTAMPTVQHLAVTPWDNRLVCANSISASGGPGGTPSSIYHVHFSQPGAPQSFLAEDNLILNPGDGEGISAVVAWRELLLVFKRTKIYVFTGTGTANGGAVFNYRPLKASVGVNAAWQVAVARDGVYFVDATGVYRTTGGEPQLISQAISPVFDGVGAVSAPFFTGPSSVLVGALAVHDNRVFCTVAAGQVFVYDLETGFWTYWTVPGQYFQGTTAGAPQMVQHSFGAARSYLYFGLTGSNDIARFSTALTADRGSAIGWLYRAGFAAPGGPGREATVRETLVEGAGTVGLDWSRDYGAVGTPVSVVLSTPPAQGRKPVLRAFAGENLSFRLSGSGTAGAQVNRVTPFLREVRGPGEKTS